MNLLIDLRACLSSASHHTSFLCPTSLPHTLPPTPQDSIAELLREHPPDDVDEEGLPFWSGVRRLPTLPTLDPSAEDQVANLLVA